MVIYPGLAWLLGSCCTWVGVRDRLPRGSIVWPAWLLVGLTVFLVGFRVGLNIQTSNVIDVGYSGVIGAYLIAHGESPYGNFPYEGSLRKCGPAEASGEVPDRIQTNGRCETADAQGDTYGSFSYEAYLPGYLAFGWSGKWDTLPAVHATTILWDLICIAGLWFVGRRYGGPRLGAALAFAWAAWPFAQYASNSNTNDMIQPALLIWGFYFASAPFLRGAFAALSSLTKFAPLIVLPLWLGYPSARSGRSRVVFSCGFAIAAALSMSVLLFEPSVWDAARTFVHRTFGYQFGRASPFSLWDWRQYHAKGLPDLHWIQQALEVILVMGALALGRWPARRSPLRLAAFTGALLVGFELVLTHWFYLYLPWFFPFAAFALIAWRLAEEPADGAGGRAESWVSLRPPERACCSSPSPRSSTSAAFEALHSRLLRAQQDHRHARVPDLRRRDARRPAPLPRLLRRVPARRAAGLRRARPTSARQLRPGASGG